MPSGFAPPSPPNPTQPLLSGDLPDLPEAEATAAAVLIAVTAAEEPGVILTLRRENLRTHAGQIAFPGGRIDPGETASPQRSAKRKRKSALDPAAVEVIGELDAYRTVTGFDVTPVLGVIPPDLDLQPHDLEVADWFEAPLGHLLDPANHRRESAVFRGAERHYHVIDWNGRRIWGATAAMLVNLSRRLRWS